MSVNFPSVQCNGIDEAQEIETSLRHALIKSFSGNPVGGSFSVSRCTIEEMEIPACQHQNKIRKKRAPEQGISVIFSLILREAGDKNDSSFMDTLEQQAAVSFQLQYLVSTGQLTITFGGKNITAERTSFKVITATYTCKDGYTIGVDGKTCGTYFLAFCFRSSNPLVVYGDLPLSKSTFYISVINPFFRSP